MRSKFENLINFIENNDIPTPISIEMTILALADKYHPQGNQKRYVKCELNGFNISPAIAELTGLYLSKDKRYFNSVIIKGCGMDMLLDLQHKAYNAACKKGYPNLFEQQKYIQHYQKEEEIPKIKET